MDIYTVCEVFWFIFLYIYGFQKNHCWTLSETETDELWMMFLETSIDVYCITNTFDDEIKLPINLISCNKIFEDNFKHKKYTNILYFDKICFIPIRILISYDLCLKSLIEMFWYYLLKFIPNLYCILYIYEYIFTWHRKF